MTRAHAAAAPDGQVKLSVHELLKTRGTVPRVQVFVCTADEVTL